MLWLSKLLPGVGAGIAWPALITVLILTMGQLWQKRDDRLVDAGRTKCDATWQVANAEAQREAARQEAQRAQELLAEERTIMERLTNDLEQTRQKYAGYIPGNDPRCLSDGVLDALRRRQSVDGGR